MLKIDNVSKIYKLGQIGGTTFRDELQRFGAKLLKKDDPTKKIGSKEYAKGDTFMALNGVSFEVKKGERVGIIGHNGAGKSTLLKLISRVTAPSSGEISMNGRIASMLEVGTGFHPELTGRENVYMNGAILGMTKAEIDKKMEDIIEFSECRKFIDTPVKRYSSGMYVKLAFSVAAHLDSEILIMDEVLAVGDMAFQKKCLDKMSDVSKKDGRTILYVSHNMNTIRQLCDRCVVLDHGTVIFDGDVEEGISIYMGADKTSGVTHILYTDEYRSNAAIKDGKIFKELTICNDFNVFKYGDKIHLLLQTQSNRLWENVIFRFEIYCNGKCVGTSFTKKAVNVTLGENLFDIWFDTNHIVRGKYIVNIIAFQCDQNGNELKMDGVYPGFSFEISDEFTEDHKINWLSDWWGNIHLEDSSIVIKEV